MVAQILVNLGCHHSAGRNGGDDRSRATCAVSACEDARQIRKGSGALCADLSSFYRDARLLKVARLNVLADGYNKHVAGDVEVLFAGRPDAGSAVLDGADHLGR